MRERNPCQVRLDSLAYPSFRCIRASKRTELMVRSWKSTHRHRFICSRLTTARSHKSHFLVNNNDSDSWRIVQCRGNTNLTVRASASALMVRWLACETDSGKSGRPTKETMTGCTELTHGLETPKCLAISVKGGDML